MQYPQDLFASSDARSRSKPNDPSGLLVADTAEHEVDRIGGLDPDDSQRFIGAVDEARQELFDRQHHGFLMTRTTPPTDGEMPPTRRNILRRVAAIPSI